MLKEIAGTRAYNILKKRKMETVEDVCQLFKLAEEYAFLHQIPFKLFQADWEKYGKATGPIRNRKMAEYANALLAFDKGTKGTRNMIQMARKYHLRGIIVEIGKGVMG